MALRAAIVACIFLAYSCNNVFAQNCTCMKIGLGFCIPDPTCSIAVDKKLEKVDHNTDTALDRLEQATQDAAKKGSAAVAKTINKAAQDTGLVIKKSVQEIHEAAAPLKRFTILETGYSQLPELGKEEAGYGLYSYAILSSNSERSAAFLAEVFKSIPSIQETAAKRAQLNIFYVPIQNGKSDEFADAIRSSGDVKKLGTTYAASLYDYKLGRAILDHICNPPADEMRALCEGDASRGPYIFTYEKPASEMEPVPPPFLFVDLSDVDPRAFSELVSAFRAQVKRENIADGARLKTPRLALLQLVLKASDWIPPVQKSIADIVHSIGFGGK